MGGGTGGGTGWGLRCCWRSPGSGNSRSQPPAGRRPAGAGQAVRPAAHRRCGSSSRFWPAEWVGGCRGESRPTRWPPRHTYKPRCAHKYKYMGLQVRPGTSVMSELPVCCWLGWGSLGRISLCLEKQEKGGPSHVRTGHTCTYACICRPDVHTRGLLRVPSARAEHRLCAGCCSRGTVGNRADRHP